jgi:hypothetical protein
VGGNQADVDMVLTQPTTNEIAWVQVKSRSTQAELDDYVRRFHTDGSFHRCYFIYHSAPKELRMHHRSMAALLQHRAAALFARIQTTGTGGHCPVFKARRIAPTSSASNGRKPIMH